MNVPWYGKFHVLSSNADNTTMFQKYFMANCQYSINIQIHLGFVSGYHNKNTRTRTQARMHKILTEPD